MSPEKKTLLRRVLANLATACLFILLYIASHRILASLLVIGDVKMGGISSLGTQFFRIVCVAGGIFSLVSWRSIPFFGGAALAVLALMALGIRQDINDLAEFYPEKIDQVTGSILLTGWGKAMLVSSGILLLLSLANVCLTLRPAGKPTSNSSH